MRDRLAPRRVRTLVDDVSELLCSEAEALRGAIALVRADSARIRREARVMRERAWAARRRTEEVRTHSAYDPLVRGFL